MSWAIIAGLLLSGVTALPLQREMDLVTGWLNADAGKSTSGLMAWLVLVRDALHEVYARYPFIGYGTDWLAFAHIAIAIAFVGTIQHPIRNSWLFTWGQIICVLVIPWAFICGEVRHIPAGWRMIDSMFGIVGFLPCWLGRRYCRELERLRIPESELK